MSRTQEIQVPGAPMPPTDSELSMKVEQLEAQLAAEKAAHDSTRRQLAVALEARPQGAVALTAYEPETEHGRAAKAASQHLHMTSDECLRAGVNKVVLTKDGFYVPSVLHVS